MSRAAELGVMDPPAEWVECPNCSDGLERACPLTLGPPFAEACPHDPPCPLARCKVCGGDRGWRRADVG